MTSLVESHIKFRRLSRLLSARSDATGFPEISPAMIQVLYALRGSPNTIKGIREILGVSSPAVGGMVKDASKAGLVSIDPDPDDARAKCVQVTLGGLAVWDQYVVLCHREGEAP